MHDTLIDHTRVRMWKFYELGLAPKMGSMAYKYVVIFLFYKFMNIPHCIPWKLEKSPFSFPIPRRAT
jgi:hypothetical protein